MAVDRPAVTIRSRGLRGYGAAIVGAFTAVWAVLTAFGEQIWLRPARVVVWLILIILCALAAVVLEVSFRLDYVKVADGRVRWWFRQGGRGDQPVSAVRSIEPLASGVVVRFSDGGPLLIGGGAFRPRDINRVVSALESGGAPAPT